MRCVCPRRRILWPCTHRTDVKLLSYSQAVWSSASWWSGRVGDEDLAVLETSFSRGEMFSALALSTNSEILRVSKSWLQNILATLWCAGWGGGGGGGGGGRGGGGKLEGGRKWWSVLKSRG